MPETPPHQPAPPPSRRPGGGDLGAKLSRKLGPLPLYAWIVVVVAAYFLWRHFHHPSSGALGDTAANTAGLGASTYVPTGDQSGGGTGEAGTPGTGTQDLVPGEPPAPGGGGGGTTTTGGTGGGGPAHGTFTQVTPDTQTQALQPAETAPSEGGPLYLGAAGAAGARAAAVAASDIQQHHRVRQHHERKRQQHEKPKKRKG
jgi:hypothetical protein